MKILRILLKEYFSPEKCCCIVISAYVFVFIAVFYFKQNERRKKFDEQHFCGP